MDLDAALSCSLEHIVDTVLFILRRRTTQIELGTQPPVEDEDLLLCLWQLLHLVSYLGNLNDRVVDV